MLIESISGNVNLINANATGDIEIIAAGVFAGNIAAAILRGIWSWWFAGYERQDLERTITSGVVAADRQIRESESALD